MCIEIHVYMHSARMSAVATMCCIHVRKPSWADYPPSPAMPTQRPAKKPRK